MHMRMKIQPPVMRMQDHGHADLGAQVFRVQPKILQGAGNTKKKDGKHLSLMVPGQ